MNLRVLLLLLAAALLGGALALVMIPRTEAPEEPAPDGGRGGASCSPGEHRVRVYLTGPGGDTSAPPEPATRCAAFEAGNPEAELRAALELLLAGPTEEERGRGLTTNVPAGTRLLDVEVHRPWATVDFSAELERLGGTAAVGGLLDQLAWTITGVEGVGAAILEVEGERVGIADHPFTGEGFLFDALRRHLGDWLRELSPARALDVFIASIGDAERMWALMGPGARALWRSADRIDVSAWSEGLGAWRDYEIIEEKIEGDRATVTIGGHQRLEGEDYPNARFTAQLVREDGIWKYDSGQMHED